MKTGYDILIAGVGGQGILLTADIISLAALASGYDVKKSETHGMAQRGGSVVTHVRIGGKVNGILIPKGGADMIIASEPVEALRYIEYLKPGGKLIVNTKPVTVPGYPDLAAVYAELDRQGAVKVDAIDLAVKAGHPLTQNSALIGAASRYLPVGEETIKETMRSRVPKKLEENLKAFDLGRNVT